MLKKLLVRNYALIRELEIVFDKGLTILTGETGAGKSIILGAMSLILGSRADTSALLNKTEKCIVEGVFDIDYDRLDDFFRRNDLDKSSPAVIRREISPNGRSRAFINDTPVTLDVMKELGSCLIDIHSQHQSLLLGSNNFQLSVIDSFADHNSLLNEYSNLYDEYRKLKKEYGMLADKRDKNIADLDYYAHQLKQLEEQKLVEGEEKDMEAEHEILAHAEEIQDALTGSSELISGGDYSVVSRLNELRRLLERITDFYPDASELIKRTSSVIIELNDIDSEADRKASSVDSDPSRLEFVSQRLDMLNSLMQKHRVSDVKSLIDKREEIRDIVSGIETSDERLSQLESMLDKSFSRLNELSGKISENRNYKVPDIENEMNHLLVELGIPNGRFEIKIDHTDDFTPNGRDHAEFRFSANRQTLPENLARIASGGELSRVMLSLKSLLTDNKSLPTVFFDEIDAGVSGEVATRVGNILSRMGRNMQVINITHLPQVAAHGDMHYYVYKEDEGDSTITYIKLLNENDRLLELARLLSGDEITKASIENARELIKGVCKS